MLRNLEQKDKIIEETAKRIRDILDEVDPELWVDILYDSTGNMTNSQRSLLASLF